jgi:hypothetical protein
MWALTVIPAVAAAVVGLVTYLSPEISPRKRWTVISLTLITIAAVVFNGWWESHKKVVEHQTNIDAIKAISALIDDADAIQQTLLATNDPVTIKTQYAAWFAKTNTTLTEKLDSSYATSFRSAPNVPQMPVNHSMEGGGYWAALEGKKIILNNIITELRQSK